MYHTCPLGRIRNHFTAMRELIFRLSVVPACWSSEPKESGILRRALRVPGRWPDAAVSLQLPLLHSCLRVTLACQNSEWEHSLNHLHTHYYAMLKSPRISQASVREWSQSHTLRQLFISESALADCHLSDLMMPLLWGLSAGAREAAGCLNLIGPELDR